MQAVFIVIILCLVFCAIAVLVRASYRHCTSNATKAPDPWAGEKARRAYQHAELNAEPFLCRLRNSRPILVATIRWENER